MEGKQIGAIIAVLVVGMLGLCLCTAGSGAAYFVLMARPAPVEIPEAREVNIEPNEKVEPKVTEEPPPPAEPPPSSDEDKVPIGSP